MRVPEEGYSSNVSYDLILISTWFTGLDCYTRRVSYRSRNCLPFAGIWVHLGFFVFLFVGWFVLLILLVSCVECCLLCLSSFCVICSFFLYLWIVNSVLPFRFFLMFFLRYELSFKANVKKGTSPIFQYISKLTCICFIYCINNI